MMNDEHEWEVMREIWLITERRDGATYKTRYLRDDWTPMGAYGDGADLIYVPSARLLFNPRRKGV